MTSTNGHRPRGHHKGVLFTREDGLRASKALKRDEHGHFLPTGKKCKKTRHRPNRKTGHLAFTGGERLTLAEGRAILWAIELAVHGDVLDDTDGNVLMSLNRGVQKLTAACNEREKRNKAKG